MPVNMTTLNMLYQALKSMRRAGWPMLFCQAAILWSFGAMPSSAAPTITNVPTTAGPGDIVGVWGNGFGSSPRLNVWDRFNSKLIKVKIIQADNNFVAFQMPKDQPFVPFQVAVSDGTSYSPVSYINSPKVMQFDVPEVAAGDTFRIFGRNLYVAGSPSTPVVTFYDHSSNAQLVAKVDLTKSDAYSLTVTAPSGIIAGRSYWVWVTNTPSTAWSETCILARSGGGEDHFKLGVPWGRDYIYKDGPNYNKTVENADHHFYDVTNDPFLKLHAKGDGITDDQPAIQAAIDKASVNGGVVYFPAGTYRLASPSGSALYMASKVVLQGHSSSDTTLLIGPSTKQASSYIYWGIHWKAGATLSGLAHIGIKNADTFSQNVRNAVTQGSVDRIFLSDVNWDLNTGLFLSLDNTDRLVVTDSTFHHAINRQQPSSKSPDDSGVAPIWFDFSTNLTFKNNTLWWASGGNAFLTLKDAVIENNHFTRSASDKILVTASNLWWLNGHADAPIKIGDYSNRQLGRQIAVEFAKNLVIQNNIFDVTDGTLTKNRNDGETINSEGGAYLDQQDTGTVVSADATSVTGGSKTWNYIPKSAYNLGSRIAILSGKGAGQWRQITSLSGNTFKISAAWDVIPAAGDNFTIFVPSMENALLRNNTMSNNTHGILLFASAFYNVSVLNNTLTDNGGIWLDSIQDIYAKSFKYPKIGYQRNIEVIGNTIKNTQGYLPAYIVIRDGLLNPNYIWGLAMDGLEVRDNSVTGKSGTPKYDFADGQYMNRVVFADPDTSIYVPNGPAPNGLVGTIFQGNNCTSCPYFYSLSTGVADTILWNSSVNGVLQTSGSPILKDEKIWSGATQSSTGTIIGHD